MNYREFLRGSRPFSLLDCSTKFGVALKTNQKETKTNRDSTNWNQSLTQNHSLDTCFFPPLCQIAYIHS